MCCPDTPIDAEQRAVLSDSPLFFAVYDAYCKPATAWKYKNAPWLRLIEGRGSIPRLSMLCYFSALLRISSRNRLPNRRSFTSPTPGIARNSASVRGLAAAIARRVASLKMA